MNLDTSLLLFINALSTDKTTFAVVNAFVQNPLLRGGPIFFAFTCIWFSKNSAERQAKMLLGLAGLFIAVFISVQMQSRLPIHLRPWLDHSLAMQGPQTVLGWERISSFPSDTATLFVSMAMIVFLQNRLVGTCCFLWALATTGVGRIVLGYHYPSDILVGALLGITIVYLVSKPQFLQNFIAYILKSLKERIYFVHGLVVLFLIDSYILFPGLDPNLDRVEELFKHLMR